jgi:uncharacterized protein
MYIERDLTQTLKKTAATRPSLILTGARQVGKTTLLRETFPQAEYLTFDNILNVASAREAPLAFLGRFSGPVILDEVQYVPELFPALKERIDKDREAMGRWILTGSQRFELMRKVSESLAGRIGVLHLESLSARELRECGAFSSAQCGAALFAGGYPELWKTPEIDREAWFESYIRTYVERDLKDLVQVKTLVAFRRLLGIAASRAGELVNYADLGAACGVTTPTVKAWLAALETSGLVYILPPFFSNFEKRLVKAPKLYFADTGFLCALLGIDSEKSLEKSGFAGHIWENFVFDELVKNGSGLPGRNLFFFRDHSGNEVDFVIQRPEGLALVEAKYAERLRPDRIAFDRVSSLLPDTISSRRVAAPSGSAQSLPMKDYEIYDPRFSV